MSKILVSIALVIILTFALVYTLNTRTSTVPPEPPTPTPTLNPNFEQYKTLLTNSSATQFGRFVGFNEDATVLVVGTYDGVYVYDRTNDGWTQNGTKIQGTGGTTTDLMGANVVISSDGTLILIGSTQDNSQVGAAFLFKKTGSTWAQVGDKLLGTGYVGSPAFGRTVQISGDNSTLVITGSADNNIGATWIFTYDGTSVTQQGSKIVGTGYTGNPVQGASSSVTHDGNMLCVGGPSDDSDNGMVWIFLRSATWIQLQSITNPSTDAANFGTSVKLANDSLLFVGGVGDNAYVGAVWVYKKSIYTFSNIYKIVPSDNIGLTYFGSSVSCSTDGARLTVSGYADNSNIGATWVFLANTESTIWTQLNNKLVGTGYSDAPQQGQDNSLMSKNGNFIAVSGWNNGSEDIPAIWTFYDVNF